MAQETKTPHDEPFTEGFVRHLIHEHEVETLPRLRRLWEYYRNELDFTGGDPHRRYSAGQEQGLPTRLVSARRGDGGKSREVVVENDIGWRIHTMVDFMFPASPSVSIQSLAPDADRAALLKRVLDAALDGNGGVGFFQNLAILGAVYGFVDVIVRPIDASSTGVTPAARAPSNHVDPGRVLDAASKIVLETVEAPRALPVLDPSDYRRLVGYVLHYTQALNEVEHSSFLARLVGGDGRRHGRQRTVEVTEVWTGESVRVWHNGRAVSESANVLGVLPVAHIQNLPQPLFYEGLGEVEPLIPLQDELNTRLSDRANRVTLQSFKMYLGKGIEGFAQRPVGPGQMWVTDNTEASIEAFGGDAHNPSEESHINEIREAMDKTSGVSALAAGVLRGRIGNLSSENALRVTLMGLLAKTERKRIGYGKGIAHVCRLILHVLHVAGVLRTTEEERGVCLHWPSPLPENKGARLKEAEAKLRVGVPRERVLAELGYGEC